MDVLNKDALELYFLPLRGHSDSFFSVYFVILLFTFSTSIDHIILEAASWISCMRFIFMHQLKMCIRRMRPMFLRLQSAGTQLLFCSIDVIVAQFNWSETKSNFKMHHVIYADGYLRQAGYIFTRVTLFDCTQHNSKITGQCRRHLSAFCELKNRINSVKCY